MEKPRVSHMQAVKRILRYIKGITNLGVLHLNSNKCSLADIEGFIDSSWRSDADDGKSIAGQVFQLCRAPVSW